MCSADVASALVNGVLDYVGPNMSTNLNVDTTGNTFAGTINGRIKVYIDPYESLADGPVEIGMLLGIVELLLSMQDCSTAHTYHCRWSVPLRDTFQPRIAFKTRYGMRIHLLLASSTAITDPILFAPSAKMLLSQSRVNNIM